MTTDTGSPAASAAAGTAAAPMHRFRTEEIRVDPGRPRIFAPGAIDPERDTLLVTLGTGTPSPNPFRYGPAGAVIAGGHPYLIDAGEGIMRAIAKAATAHNRLLVDCFAPRALDIVFLTHLHSDHVSGLPSLILSPWIFGRSAPLRVVGPAGTRDMVSHLLQAFGADIRERIHGIEHANDSGWRVEVTEVSGDGLVFQDERVRVEAFAHEHGSIENFGYLFTTPALPGNGAAAAAAGRKIAWAGDGKAGAGFTAAVRDADLLASEICSEANVAKAPWGGISEEEKQKIIWAYHVKPRELADLAREARVKTLVLIHESNYSNPYEVDALEREMREAYDGHMVASRDADIF